MDGMIRWMGADEYGRYLNKLKNHQDKVKHIVHIGKYNSLAGHCESSRLHIQSKIKCNIILKVFRVESETSRI